jgi:hypothetical protein
MFKFLFLTCIGCSISAMSLGSEYKEQLDNGYRNRAARGFETFASKAKSDTRAHGSYIISFVSPIDMRNAVADAIGSGLAVDELHVATGERVYVFELSAERSGSEMAGVTARYTQSLETRRSELNSQLAGSAVGDAHHWLLQELRYLDQEEEYLGSNKFPRVIGLGVSGRADRMSAYLATFAASVRAIDVVSGSIRPFAMPVEYYAEPTK